MWFRNLRVYSFSQPFEIPADLQSRLQEHKFKSCSRTEPVSVGWVSPFVESEILALEQQGAVLLCLRKEEKVVPASAVKEELELRKRQFEQENAYVMPRKEQQTIKEDILHEFMPRALSKFSVTWGFIDTQTQRVFIDASSAKKAEEFTALVRTCIGSLPVQPFAAEGPGSLFMTDWVKNSRAPEQFELGHDAELKHISEDQMVVKLKGHDLDMPEVLEHLNQNKRVTELSLLFQERVQFSLADDYAVKRVKFTDQVLEQRDQEGLDAAAQLDADFALMRGEFNALLEALMKGLQ
ncbi:MAG: recombination associated protein RdgC [Idiomarinaceae bacterium HL-53]|nr:MAG: recombination associated protein RdgC [Idiomarinaceae bacterium HL-53]CUS48341.1 recombination associated protein RdgC [Idiomarinaceae bacterium HL-53]